MNRTLAPLVLVVAQVMASQALAQAVTPVTPAVQAASNKPLDAIVAIVNDQVITRFDLRDAVLAKIQQKQVDEPKDSVTMVALERETLSDMIQDELLIQSAKDLKITIADADISPQVDAQIRNAKLQMSETEFRSELIKAGLGTPEEYRKFLMDQYRRQYTRERVIQKLTQDGKIVPVSVAEPEITAEFEKAKQFLPKKPPTVSFKQIVIAPQPTAAAKDAARAKADSVLAQIKAGADFEKIAKRESMDLETKETGGDLGWIRRGTQLPEMERWIFGSPFQPPVQPGQVSAVFETPFGFHIIRVDRANGAAEVKVHQISDHGQGRLERHRQNAKARGQRRQPPAQGNAVRHAGQEVPRLSRPRRDEHPPVLARQLASDVSKGLRGQEGRRHRRLPDRRLREAPRGAEVRGRAAADGGRRRRPHAVGDA